MLNYVWIALIMIGIGAAVSTDINNSITNKFNNGKVLEFEVKNFNKEDFKENKSNDYILVISPDASKKYFNETIKEPFELKAKLTQIDYEQYQINININNTVPKVLKEIASASGEKDDINGIVKNVSINQESNSIFAKIELEEVSFLKLKELTNSAIDYSEIAVKIALGLIGVMALWLGIMKIAEEAGLITYIARGLKPITKFLFPDVPPEHPAVGSIIMNVSANFLGLGNAATPFGLKAMEELDKLNTNKGTATNAMCTFLAINTAGLTLIPATAIAIRAASGSSQPAIIIGTAIFGSLCATTVGITAAKIFENFPIKSGEIFSWIKNHLKFFIVLFSILLIGIVLYMTGVYTFFSFLSKILNPETLKKSVQIISTIAIPVIIVSFIGFGFYKKVKVYETFVEGAKEGFNVAVRIIPYLVAMLFAIGIFRTGGAMDWLVFLLQPITNFIGMPTEALPMALMRPLSGSGSLGIMAEIISVHGPDSFIGILVSTFYGSTETTFYVLAVYFGAVNIKNTRHALPAGLLADVAGILGALFIVKLLFG